MNINELQDLENPYKRKSKKRVGRGIGSGTGKTAGRGHKGQKSRAGAAIKGFNGGQMPIYMRLPKRGFVNPFRKIYQTINLGEIQAFIEAKRIDASKEITKEYLLDLNILKKKELDLKILAKGKISAAIKVKAHKASESAIKAIEKAGGSVSIIEKKVTDKKEDK